MRAAAWPLTHTSCDIRQIAAFQYGQCCGKCFTEPSWFAMSVLGTQRVFWLLCCASMVLGMYSGTHHQTMRLNKWQEINQGCKA